MIKPILAIALTLTCLSAIPAQAQDHSRRLVVRSAYAPPLTIQKRSWLDSGNVVAVGTMDSVRTQSTYLNQPIYSNYAPDRFGASTLPGQFDLAFSNENPRGPSSGGIFFDTTP